MLTLTASAEREFPSVPNAEFREGIEDYEFHWLLRERLGKRRAGLKPDEASRYEALLEVPAEITRDMTTFTTDPSPIYARRAAIAEAIERLGAAEK